MLNAELGKGILTTDGHRLTQIKKGKNGVICVCNSRAHYARAN